MTEDGRRSTPSDESACPFFYPRPPALRSDAELALEQFIDRLRVGLAGGSFHHLTDEPADQRRLGLCLLHLVGVAGDNVVDHLLDRRKVGDLLQAARFRDRM